MQKVILRADGNSEIGLGHFYRALALATIIKDEYNCLLAISAPDTFIKNTAKEAGIKIIELPKISYKLPENIGQGDELLFDLKEYLTGNEILVIDGYWFGPNYQKEAKKHCKYLIYIDDNLTPNFFADAIINHAPGVNADQYQVNKNTRLYLGLDYLLLRPAFYAAKDKAKINKKSILISLGGSDAYSLTLPLTKKAMHLAPDAEINILITPAFKQDDIKAIYALAEKCFHIKIHKGLSAEELVNLIDASTHCIVAASTVALECFARQIRSFCGYYVSNQQNIYNGLLSLGYIYSAGNLLHFSPETEKKLGLYLQTDNHILENNPVTSAKSRILEIFKQAPLN